MLTRPILLPWRIDRLPRWVAVLPGLLFAASAILKIPGPLNACGSDPWGVLNVLLWVPEILCACALLSRPGPTRPVPLVATRRRRAALFGALVLSGAAALLTFLHVLGPRWNMAGADVRSCGCFGPIDLPYGVHMIILAVMIACLAAVFLHEETRLADAIQATEAKGTVPARRAGAVPPC